MARLPDHRIIRLQYLLFTPRFRFLRFALCRSSTLGGLCPRFGRAWFACLRLRSGFYGFSHSLLDDFHDWWRFRLGKFFRQFHRLPIHVGFNRHQEFVFQFLFEAGFNLLSGLQRRFCPGGSV